MVVYVRRVNGKCNLFHRYLPFQCYLLLECDRIVWHVTERGIRLVFYYYQYSRFNFEWNFRNLYPNVMVTQWKLTLVVVNHLKEMCLMSKHGFVINLTVITHLSLRYEICINSIHAATFKQWKWVAPCHTGKSFLFGRRYLCVVIKWQYSIIQIQSYGETTSYYRLMSWLSLPSPKMYVAAAYYIYSCGNITW